jgi:hypothetical protein
MAGYGANLSNKERQQLKDDVFEIVPEGVEGVVPYRYVATTLMSFSLFFNSNCFLNIILFFIFVSCFVLVACA